MKIALQMIISHRLLLALFGGALILDSSCLALDEELRIRTNDELSELKWQRDHDDDDDDRDDDDHDDGKHRKHGKHSRK